MLIPVHGWCSLHVNHRIWFIKFCLCIHQISDLVPVNNNKNICSSGKDFHYILESGCLDFSHKSMMTGFPPTELSLPKYKQFMKYLNKQIGDEHQCHDHRAHTFSSLWCLMWKLIEGFDLYDFCNSALPWKIWRGTDMMQATVVALLCKMMCKTCHT